MNSTKKYIRVAFPLPLNKLFLYSVPSSLKDMLQVGSRVLAPFGKRKLTGYIIDVLERIDEDYNFKIRQIDDVLDDVPVFTSDLMLLADWISKYYLSSYGEALRAMLPRGMNQESRAIINLIDKEAALILISKTDSFIQKQILSFLVKTNKTTVKELEAKLKVGNLYSALSKIENKGIIEKVFDFQRPLVSAKFESWYRINDDNFSTEKIHETIDILSKTAPKQSICLKFLAVRGTISRRDLMRETRVTSSSIQGLLNKKLIIEYEKEVFRSYYNEENLKMKEILLNTEQLSAKEELAKGISRKIFRPFLLHGVTGSGKTQVYIEAIRDALEIGRSAIVLVPEISLTPQTVRRFKANFPGLVTVLHSHMSVGERYDSWRQLRNGTFRIAIGPRSAIFAPLENIGLIVIDEEHENTYKQSEQRPYYHARDVAVMRGKINDAVVILGSATPSVESYYNTRIQKYRLLNLNNRIDNIPLPRVNIIDMAQQRKLYPNRKKTIFSVELEDKIKDRIAKKQQIILLQNRRGYSTFVRCKECGYVEQCVNCNITLTYHMTANRLRCHYCDYQKHSPSVCPSCKSNRLEYQGVGTQQVEEYIKQKLPDVRVIRMDLDTVRRKRAHDRIIQEFNEGKYDILLGTQMIAKGHDFDRVTLVGVISADTTLLLPDFRSTERTFQLLTQVAGRAGRRSEQGEVIIQTYYPDHFGIECARTHNYMKFYASEIIKRSELRYPPYTRLIQILVRGRDEPEIIMLMKSLKGTIQDRIEDIEILGPVPAPLVRIKNFYRWHILLKVNKLLDRSGKLVNEQVQAIGEEHENQINRQGLQISVNIDPMTIL